MIEHGVGTSITGRAIRQNTITLETVNIRDFSQDKHRRVDDYTYGGGAGMLMQPQPVYDAWSMVMEKTIGRNSGRRVRTIYVTPQGYPFTQKMAEDFAGADDLIFLCGHYEGIDERVLEEVVTDYVSIGDYVLTGGELAAMVMIDAISRLVPGVLHNEVSADTESFHGSLLEYPQYSRPEEWHGKRVPEILLSGNPRQVEKWRLEASVARTKERRPDLYREYEKLQSARKLLMKNKLLHMDMISLIDQGKVAELKAEADDIMIRSTAGDYYLTAGAREYCDIPKMAESCLHGGEAPEGWRSMKQYVLTRREKLPVTGLYRPDGKPSPQGLVIVKDKAKWTALQNGEEAGSICMSREGRMEALIVKEEFRRRHVGMALVTCLCNYLLETGIIPVCRIPENNAEACALAEKLGMYAAKAPVYIRE